MEEAVKFGLMKKRERILDERDFTGFKSIPYALRLARKIVASHQTFGR